MGRNLVLVGAGHAHLTTMSAIRSLVKRGHTVTTIAPSDHHYYSGMAPGMLAGTYRPQEIRFNVRKLITGRGGRFIQGRASGVDADRREVILQDGQRVPYDVVSFNVGSVPVTAGMDVGNGSVFTVKPIERVLEGRIRTLEALAETGDRGPLALAVVGGGPAGVEMAGGLQHLTRDAGVRCDITLYSSGRILSGLPKGVRRRALESLAGRGVRVLEEVAVRSLDQGRLVREDGTVEKAAVTFLAAGIRPSPLFRGTPFRTAEDGGLLVNSFLQSVSHPEVFGGGDCVTLQDAQLARVGVYAVRQNPVILKNLASALEDKPLQRFNPGAPSYLLILNMGDGTAILRKGRWVFDGKLAFKIKDFIDRRFMRKFQLSGELEEEL